MDFFWIPDKVKCFVMMYYEDFQMLFTTGEYTTRWVNLEVWYPDGLYIYHQSYLEVITKAAEMSWSIIQLWGGVGIHSSFH